MIRNISFLCLLVVMISCFERKEGCLDTLAANFEVDAFDPCDGCCTYPNLVFRFNHMAGDSLLRTEDTLVNNWGQAFNILEVRFYLSEIELFQEGTPARVFSTIINADNTTVLADDIKISRTNISQLAMGAFKSFGNFEKVSYRLGVNNAVMRDSFINLPTNHPLIERNKIRDSEGQLYQMIVRYKVINPDTIRTIWIDSFPSQLVFVKEEAVTTRKGDDILFNIDADYLPLFQNTFLTGDPSEISKKMATEAAKIFEK